MRVSDIRPRKLHPSVIERGDYLFDEWDNRWRPITTVGTYSAELGHLFFCDGAYFIYFDDERVSVKVARGK